MKTITISILFLVLVVVPLVCCVEKWSLVEAEKKRAKEKVKEMDELFSDFNTQFEKPVVDPNMAVFKMTPSLYEYIVNISVTETSVQKHLRHDNSFHNDEVKYFGMPPDEAQFLSFLTELLNVKNYLEVGVFTGYSILSMAKNLPEDGKITAIELNKDYIEMAKTFWGDAKIHDKIDVRIGTAEEELKKLINEGKSNTYDLALIDADRKGLDQYYELTLQLVRKGGVIVIDNVLSHGKVIDKKDNTKGTNFVRKLNKKLKEDKRVSISTLSIADGVTLVLKK